MRELGLVPILRLHECGMAKVVRVFAFSYKCALLRLPGADRENIGRATQRRRTFFVSAAFLRGGDVGGR